tara:strand:+ start:144 stop:392 length:249 start_codon:yes stop_codon:yes gene_type:complete
MSDKSTKKDLQAKIETLEKELYLYKNKTQLARNYDIIKAENAELQKKLHKKKEWWASQCEACKAVVEDEEESDEEESDEEDC